MTERDQPKSQVRVCRSWEVNPGYTAQDPLVELEIDADLRDPGTKLHTDPRGDLVAMWLEEAARNGSSISLSWGEDPGVWECSWVTGGQRFTGLGTNPAGAMAGMYVAWHKALNA